MVTGIYYKSYLNKALSKQLLINIPDEIWKHTIGYENYQALVMAALEHSPADEAGGDRAKRLRKGFFSFQKKSLTALIRL